MKSTIEYLDETKKALNLPSDYALAKELSVTKQTVAGYRSGARTLDDYTAVKIADALGIDPLEVIAAANLEREKDGKRQELWRKVYSRCTAASLAFFTVFSGTYGTDGKAGASSLKDNTIYIMRSSVAKAKSKEQVEARF